MKFFMPQFDRYVRDMFKKMGHTLVDSIDACDFVVFTGGADVTPSLYGEVNKYSYCDALRDEYEVQVFEVAKDLGKKMVGICRGSQFLTVMAGGKLWQDVNNHATGLNHVIYTTKEGEWLTVSSTHHQMMRPEGVPHELLGWARLSNNKRAAIDSEKAEPNRFLVDPEAVYYPDINAVACQFHPEYFAINHQCPKYFFRILKEKLEIVEDEA